MIVKVTEKQKVMAGVVGFVLEIVQEHDHEQYAIQKTRYYYCYQLQQVTLFHDYPR